MTIGPATTTAVLQSGPPPAPLQTPEFRNTRPLIIGPEAPEPPFPIALAGSVQKGFGRGGKELGCPTDTTANLPDDSIFSLSTVAKTGVYYGYAQVIPPQGQRTALDIDDLTVYPMVMSLGWNPFYKNERLTAEVHIMHNFKADFYGYEMRALVLGYIRPELDYTSRETLIQDIELDKKVALNCLDRPAYRENASHSHFSVVEDCSRHPTL